MDAWTNTLKTARKELVKVKSLLDMLTKKSFNLEFETLDIPTAAEICESIQDYAYKTEAKVEFISNKMPVRFNLDGITYGVRRGTSRGGPTVACIEE